MWCNVLGEQVLCGAAAVSYISIQIDRQVTRTHVVVAAVLSEQVLLLNFVAPLLFPAATLLDVLLRGAHDQALQLGLPLHEVHVYEHRLGTRLH